MNTSQRNRKSTLSQSLHLVDQANRLFVVWTKKTNVQSSLNPMARSSELLTNHSRLLSMTGFTWGMVAGLQEEVNQLTKETPQRHAMTSLKSHSTLHYALFRRPTQIQGDGALLTREWQILAKDHLGRDISLLWKCHLLQPSFCLQKFICLAYAKNIPTSSFKCLLPSCTRLWLVFNTLILLMGLWLWLLPTGSCGPKDLHNSL